MTTVYDSGATEPAANNPDAPMQGAVALTVAAAAVAPGRLFVINASVAGNVTVKFPDGSTHVIAAPVGYTSYKYAVSQVTVSTATATYANLI